MSLLQAIIVIFIYGIIYLHHVATWDNDDSSECTTTEPELRNDGTPRLPRKRKAADMNLGN